METQIKEVECKACDTKIDKFDHFGNYKCQCGEIGNKDGRSAVEGTFCLECEGFGTFEAENRAPDNFTEVECVYCKGTGNPKEAFPEMYDNSPEEGLLGYKAIKNN